MTDPIDRVIRRRYQPSLSSEAFLDGVRARARVLELEAASTGRPTPRAWRHSVQWGVAGLGIAAAAMLVITSPFSPEPATRSTREYTTVPGQTATVTLGDGSTMTLAPATRIRYTIGQQNGTRQTGTRTVELDGEAYFSVRHADDIPFVITTEDVVTTVLGTEFGIKKYTGDTKTRVAVVTGKVSSKYASKSVVLTEGMTAVLGDSSIQTATVPDMQSYTGWVDGTLIFENVPADSMLTTLNRWYGYRFQLADSTLGKRRVTAAFDTRTPSRAFTALGILLDVEITVRDSVVTLVPGRANQRHEPPAKRQGGDEIPVLMEVGR